MNVRIFWVCAMKCMCAQTRPRFILSFERVFWGMEFEPMLTPREKSPLPENFPRGGSNPCRLDSEPKHYQRAIPAHWSHSTCLLLCRPVCVLMEMDGDTRQTEAPQHRKQPSQSSLLWSSHLHVSLLWAVPSMLIVFCFPVQKHWDANPVDTFFCRVNSLLHDQMLLWCGHCPAFGCLDNAIYTDC